MPTPRIPAGIRLHLRGHAKHRESGAHCLRTGEDNLAEGVRYIEVRYAPQLHINDIRIWKKCQRRLPRTRACAETPQPLESGPHGR